MDDLNDNSTKISELPLLSTALEDDAYFALERGTSSFKISYADLKQFVFNNLSIDASLGSMAFKDSSEYSPFAHGHNYSDIWFFPSYGPQSNNPDYKSAVSCQAYGKFSIKKYFPGQNKFTTYEISAYAPKYASFIDDQALSYNPKMIGDLYPLAIKCSFETYLTAYRKYKLKNYNGKTNIDINSSSFDGYAIPNGTTFTCAATQFKDACKKYSSNKSENATSFTVPNIQSFIKGNPCSQQTDAIKSIPYHNAMPQHSHNTDSGQIQKIYQALNIDVDGFKLYTSNTGGDSVNQFVHGGSTTGSANYSTPTTIQLTDIQLSASITDATCNLIGDDSQSYPTHNVIPLLIYIGGK